MPEQQMFIGIDPGGSGGIAILQGHDIETHKLKVLTDREIWNVLAGNDDAICIVEAVHATPQMGVTSAFKFGRAFGEVKMAAIAAGLRVELVSPQKWQKQFGLISTGRKIGKGDTTKKNRNKSKAIELFPSIKVTHAIADALLLAEYGRRLHRGIN